MESFRQLFGDNLSLNFEEISDILFNKSCLIISGRRYRILEVEYYLYEDGHEDHFAHCHPQQMEFMEWCFHRASAKSDTYRSGTYKGLDIACGSKDLKRYGGILLRSIYDLHDKKVINGPSLLVDHILSQNGIEPNNIKSFISDKLNNNLNVSFSPCLSLIISSKYLYNPAHIWKSPRVGLSLKKTDHIDDRHFFLSSFYRHLIFPHLIPKGFPLLVMCSFLYNLINNIPLDSLQSTLCLSHKRFSFYKQSSTNIFNQSPESLSSFLSLNLSDSQRASHFFSLSRSHN